MIASRTIRRAAAGLAAGGMLGAIVIAAPGATTLANASSSRTATVSTSVSAPVAVRSLQVKGALATFPRVASGSTAIGHLDPASVSEDGLYHRRLSPGGGAHPLPVEPSVSSTPITGATRIGASRTGLNAYQERAANNGNQFTFVPPDQGLCAGNGFVLESVNDALRVYDSSMRPLTGVTDTNTFYGYPPVINRTTGVFGPEPTDPSCYYDGEHHRFVQVVLTLDVDPSTGNLLGSNHLDVAVSKTADPTKSWTLYSLAAQDDGTQGTPKHKSCPCIGDYPHIGADANGIYITTNEYPFSSDPGVFGNNFNGAQIYALPKAALTSGASSVPVLHFQNLVAGGTPGFTVWPSQAASGRYATANNGTEYFAQTTAAEEALGTGTSTHLLVWKLTNTASLNTAHPAPALSAQFVNSEQYTSPPPSNQKAGSAPLGECLQVARCGNDVLGLSDPATAIPGNIDSLDGRMQQTWYDGGRLWTAFGTGMSVGGTTRTGAAYVVLNVGTSGASVATQGYVGNAQNNLLMPAVAVLPGGKGVLSLSATGDTLDPSSAFIRIDATGVHGPVNRIAAGGAPLDDFCEYNAFDCAANGSPPLARPRFGDYGAVVPMGGVLVVANEYVASSCTLNTWLADGTCGETRAPLANWATRLTAVTP